MKTIILLICVFVVIPYIYSQDKEASPLKFVWGFSSVPRPLQVDSFPQNNYLTGFQWSGTPKMNHAMLNNSTASGGIYWEDNTNYNSRRYLFNQPKYICGFDNSFTGYGTGIMNAPAMIWEPTLRIPKNDSTGMFIIREHDSTNAIFGFHHIMGQILAANQYTDQNYNRLILRKGIDTGLVLNDIWPKPQFETKAGNAQTGGYYGQKWNLTINLRRKNIPDDDTLDNSVVLEIKIPYRTTESVYRSINFDSLPRQTLNDTFRISYPMLNNFRGYELKRNGNRDSVIRIRRSMLPVDTNKKDITISGHFLTYYNNWQPNGDNPPFLGDNMEGKIDSLDIEVRNTGIMDLCIDYIKIESDEAYHLSRGALDSLGIIWIGNNDVAPGRFRIYPVANDTNTVVDYN